MPLKVPAAHEPVLWEGTELVVGVLGYNSVGRPICEVAHRVEDVAEFLGKEPEEIVTEADLEHISESSAGLLKGVQVPYRIVWSQWQRTEGGDFIESSNYNRKYIRIQRISGR